MSDFQNNIILLTDSYKLTHWVQYPPNTQSIYSYFESRVGARYPYTVFFGLQYFLKKYLEGRVVTTEGINQAKMFCNLHLGGRDNTFNEAGWQYIIDKRDGKLPIEIKAVPEGSVIPTSNVLMTIENTDPNCYWLTNYLETLLVQVWYPSTVATISRTVKEVIRAGLEKTGNISGLPFKLHDFGFRGASSVETAALGGLAHLTSFLGTDTVAAVGCGIQYYDSGVCGISIPATEHSTITSWGKSKELDAYRNLLEKYPTGLIACVSDSYDINNACSNLWGRDLKDHVLNRDGCLVVRPDSGDVIPMVLNVLYRLGEAFGTYTNEKGYRTLNDKIRVIQGDGCTPETIKKIIDAMIQNGWSIDNIAFGMGGGLLQKLDRDTQRFAFKCSAVQINGQWKDVYKQPASDPSKNSKRGKLKLINDFGNYETIPAEDNTRDELRTVFKNGELTQLDCFDAICKRARLIQSNPSL